MTIEMLKGKIHRATVVQAELDYVGSITAVSYTHLDVYKRQILEASGETASYFASAQGVISRMIAGNTPNVDAVSGATYSSNGIIQAVQNALSQAAADGNSQQVTPTPAATALPTPTSAPSRMCIRDSI